MKKYDDLLKRVEQFERMAVYSDRRTFLQALAGQTITLNNLMKDDVRAIADALIWAKDSQQIINKLTDLAAAPQVDSGELISALNEADQKMSKSPEFVPQSQKISDLLAKVQKMGTPAGMKTWQDLVTKEDATSSQPTTSKPAYAYIPKETQRQLNSLLSEEISSGKLQPLVEDGSLGPRTQEAIEAFKKRYRAAGTPLDIDKAYKLHGAMQQSLSR